MTEQPQSPPAAAITETRAEAPGPEPLLTEVALVPVSEPPLVRVAIASDLPNPLANSGVEGLQFINPDLTMFLAREPVSEWIGLDVTNHLGADGIAVGSCTLYDLAGPIGSSTVCALANEVLDINQ